VPDGVLHLVPFAALQQSSGAFLGSDRAVSYLPSAGTLSLLRSRRRSEPPRMFFGVGGVEYSDRSQSVMLADAKAGLTRGAYYDIDLTRLPDLPGTEEEIRTAAEILGTNDARLLTGRDGTESEFKAARPNQFRIVHLAVHGKAMRKILIERR
jgi:CHAT domain-containing protein